MAINKKLIHFNKKEDFEREVANGNILDKSIVFIKDTKEIYTHGTIYGSGNIDLSNYSTKEEIEKALEQYAKTQDLDEKQDTISDLDAIRSNAALGATALQSYTEQYQGTVEAVDTTESVDGVSNDFITSEQLDARGYTTINIVNQEVSSLQNADSQLSKRIANLENNSIIDARASVLWLGTSIPAGDISIDPQQNNTYPKMVADALGFELYNMAKAGSLVSWYPNHQVGLLQHKLRLSLLLLTVYQQRVKKFMINIIQCLKQLDKVKDYQLLGEMII